MPSPVFLSDEMLFQRVPRTAFLAGAAGLGVWAVGALLRPAPLFRSYLVGFSFWLGIAVGSLGILMLWHLTGGGWGRMTRRMLEAATRTLPLLAGLFLPVVLGAGWIYVWLDASAIGADPVLGKKVGYLNLPFFLSRAVVYFGVWLVLAWFLNRWSREQDETGDPRAAARMRILSGPGLVLWGLALSFAAVDWVMSLEPHWFSSIFPVVFGVGQILAAFAFAVVTLAVLSARPALAALVSTRHVHDVGNLFLTLVMFWAYVAFSQYLLIWSGNLPEETAWFAPRTAGAWGAVGAAMVVLQFAAPFALLLARGVKRRLPALGAIAGLILAISAVSLAWQVLPAFSHETWVDPALGLVGLAASLAGVGGVWLAAFLGELRKLPLAAAGDLDVPEAKPHG